MNAPRTGEDGVIRYAVVGLGWISQVAMLPAFAGARKQAKLTALVSDDPEKLTKLGETYDVPEAHRYTYEQYDRCLQSGVVDAVYIGLPNNLHADYSIRAARAGVHVLCEKPMANTEDECRAMIDACQSAGVRLMIAYRLHFEAANMDAVVAVTSGKIGEPRFFTSNFTEMVEPGNIRLDRDKGGGPVFDIGVYCINAARYLFRDEPTEAVAFMAQGPPEFAEVGMTYSAVLRFPNDRLAAFTTSFGAAKAAWYQVVGTEGDLRMDPAYPFQGSISSYLTIDGKTKESTYKERDQFAAQLLYFSDCILEGEDPEPSGLEGLIDVRIIRAVLESARHGGRPVAIEPIEKADRPGLDQVISPRAPWRPREFVEASDPSEKDQVVQ